MRGNAVREKTVQLLRNRGSELKLCEDLVGGEREECLKAQVCLIYSTVGESEVHVFAGYFTLRSSV